MCKIIPRLHDPCTCKTYEIHVCHMIHINAISFDPSTPNLNNSSSNNKKKPLPPVGVLTLDAKSYNPTLLKACPFFSSDKPIQSSYPCREHWDMAGWQNNGPARGDDGFEKEIESFEMTFMGRKDGDGNKGTVLGKGVVDVNVLATKEMKGGKKVVEKQPWWVVLVCGRRKKVTKC